MQITIGADPEVFVKKDGVLVSAYNLIKGTKLAPLPVNGGAVQVDGMALEFNIEPARNCQEFSSSIKQVMKELAKMVPDYELVVEPVAEFGEEYIKSQPEEAKMLGCDPDYNAYTGKVNPAPDSAASFRTAAGHIHIGWGENVDKDTGHMEMCQALVTTLDAFLALPFGLYDKDIKRSSLYGEIGAFRPKNYGCEYRVLSNKWITGSDVFNPDWVSESVNAAVSYLSKGNPPIKEYDLISDALCAKDGEVIREAVRWISSKYGVYIRYV